MSAQTLSKLAEALGDREKGIVLDNDNATVGEFVTRWLEDRTKGDLAPARTTTTVCRSGGTLAITI